MSIEMIAAVGRNYELGKNNELIWHFKEDMQFFKNTTTGCTVIMGRKTFESLPKALPNRRNIVITSNSDYSASGAEIALSTEQAAKMAENERAFIIGGESVYKAFLPIAETIYLTEIEAVCSDAQAFFPLFDKTQYNREVLGTSSADGVSFSFVKYTKI